MSKFLKYRAVANFKAQVKIALVLCENSRIAKDLLHDVADKEDLEIVKSFIAEYKDEATSAQETISDRFMHWNGCDNVPLDLVCCADYIVRNAYLGKPRTENNLFDWSTASDEELLPF